MDGYAVWLGTSLIRLGTRELTVAAQSGRRIEPARLELLDRAKVALATPPTVFNGSFDPSARQTPFDLQKWAILGLYQELRLDHPAGPRPEFLRRAKTDATRMLMRSLVFANEFVNLIDFDKLRSIKAPADLDARPLLELLLDGTPIDWTLRENVRAHLRRLVRRTLRKHGYPPDKQDSATKTVLEQAEVLSAGWAA